MSSSGAKSCEKCGKLPWLSFTVKIISGSSSRGILLCEECYGDFVDVVFASMPQKTMHRILDKLKNDVDRRKDD